MPQVPYSQLEDKHTADSNQGDIDFDILSETIEQFDRLSPPFTPGTTAHRDVINYAESKRDESYPFLDGFGIGRLRSRFSWYYGRNGLLVGLGILTIYYLAGGVNAWSSHFDAQDTQGSAIPTEEEHAANVSLANRISSGITLTQLVLLAIIMFAVGYFFKDRKVNARYYQDFCTLQKLNNPSGYSLFHMYDVTTKHIQHLLNNVAYNEIAIGSLIANIQGDFINRYVEEPLDARPAKQPKNANLNTRKKRKVKKKEHKDQTSDVAYDESPLTFEEIEKQKGAIKLSVGGAQNVIIITGRQTVMKKLQEILDAIRNIRRASPQTDSTDHSDALRIIERRLGKVEAQIIIRKPLFMPLLVMNLRVRIKKQHRLLSAKKRAKLLSLTIKDLREKAAYRTHATAEELDTQLHVILYIYFALFSNQNLHAEEFARDEQTFFALSTQDQATTILLFLQARCTAHLAARFFWHHNFSNEDRINLLRQAMGNSPLQRRERETLQQTLSLLFENRRDQTAVLFNSSPELGARYFHIVNHTDPLADLQSLSHSHTDDDDSDDEKSSSVRMPPQRRQAQLPAGLRYSQVPYDGHCFYRAASYHTDQSVQQLRDLVAARIESGRDSAQLQAHLEKGPYTTAQYIQRIRSTNEWAGNAEIMALSRILHRHIIVLDIHGRFLNRRQISENLYKNNAPIFVCFNGKNHYDSLLVRDSYNARTIMNELLDIADQAQKKAAPRRADRKQKDRPLDSDATVAFADDDSTDDEREKKQAIHRPNAAAGRKLGAIMTAASRTTAATASGSHTIDIADDSADSDKEFKLKQQEESVSHTRRPPPASESTRLLLGSSSAHNYTQSAAAAAASAPKASLRAASTAASSLDSSTNQTDKKSTKKSKKAKHSLSAGFPANFRALSNKEIIVIAQAIFWNTKLTHASRIRIIELLGQNYAFLFNTDNPVIQFMRRQILGSDEEQTQAILTKLAQQGVATISSEFLAFANPRTPEGRDFICHCVESQKDVNELPQLLTAYLTVGDGSQLNPDTTSIVVACMLRKIYSCQSISDTDKDILINKIFSLYEESNNNSLLANIAAIHPALSHGGNAYEIVDHILRIFILAPQHVYPGQKKARSLPNKDKVIALLFNRLKAPAHLQIHHSTLKSQLSNQLTLKTMEQQKKAKEAKDEEKAKGILDLSPTDQLNQQRHKPLSDRKAKVKGLKEKKDDLNDFSAIIAKCTNDIDFARFSTHDHLQFIRLNFQAEELYLHDIPPGSFLEELLPQGSENISTKLNAFKDCITSLLNINTEEGNLILHIITRLLQRMISASLSVDDNDSDDDLDDKASDHLIPVANTLVKAALNANKRSTEKQVIILNTLYAFERSPRLHMKMAQHILVEIVTRLHHEPENPELHKILISVIDHHCRRQGTNLLFGLSILGNTEIRRYMPMILRHLTLDLLTKPEAFEFRDVIPKNSQAKATAIMGLIFGHENSLEQLYKQLDAASPQMASAILQTLSIWIEALCSNRLKLSLLNDNTIHAVNKLLEQFLQQASNHDKFKHNRLPPTLTLLYLKHVQTWQDGRQGNRRRTLGQWRNDHRFPDLITAATTQPLLTLYDIFSICSKMPAYSTQFDLEGKLEQDAFSHGNCITNLITRWLPDDALLQLEAPAEQATRNLLISALENLPQTLQATVLQTCNEFRLQMLLKYFITAQANAAHSDNITAAFNLYWGRYPQSQDNIPSTLSELGFNIPSAIVAEIHALLAPPSLDASTVSSGHGIFATVNILSDHSSSDEKNSDEEDDEDEDEDEEDDDDAASVASNDGAAPAPQ